MSVRWSTGKKDLKLSTITFSTSDGNLSVIGLHRGHSNVNNGNEFIKELGNQLDT